MTKQEALEILDWIPTKGDEVDAMEMAIEALARDVINCKDCKYFTYDYVAKVDGVPLIVAHEICTRWSDGVKTSENGYCFLGERGKQIEALEKQARLEELMNIGAEIADRGC